MSKYNIDENYDGPQQDVEQVETPKNAPIVDALPSKNLIDLLNTTINNGIDSHPDWVEALNLGLIGAVCGDTIKLYNEIGPVQANTFFMYIGTSSQARKSSPIKNRTRPILQRVNDLLNKDVYEKHKMTKESYLQLLEDIKYTPKNSPDRKDESWEKKQKIIGKIERELIDLETPPKSTIEALTTWLVTNPHGFMVHDEFSQMLLDVKTKDYMKSSMEFLSGLYDNQIHKTATQKRGVESPKNLNVCFASATTQEFFKLCSDLTPYRQGYGNRLLYVYQPEYIKLDREQEEKRVATYWSGGAVKTEELESNMELCAKYLYNIKSLWNMSVLMLDAGTQYHSHNYIVDLDMRAEHAQVVDDNIIETSYFSRMKENFIKLMLLHCVGRYAMYEQIPDNYILVEYEDYEWAKAKCERHLEYFKQMEVQLLMNVATPLKDYTGVRDFILKLIDASNGETTLREIARARGWSKHDLLPLLDEYVADGIITISFNEYNPKTGRMRNVVRKGENVGVEK